MCRENRCVVKYSCLFIRKETGYDQLLPASLQLFPLNKRLIFDGYIEALEMEQKLLFLIFFAIIQLHLLKLFVDKYPAVLDSLAD